MKQMSKQLEQYHKFSGMVRFFMTKLCIWPKEHSGFLYKILPYIAGTICFSSITKMVYFMIDNYNNLADFSRGMVLFSGVSAVVVKVRFLSPLYVDPYKVDLCSFFFSFNFPSR